MRKTRLIFFAALPMLAACGGDGAIVTQAGTVTEQASGPTGTTNPRALSAVMLREHNAARAAVGVGPLRSDTNLERDALAYAQEMARTGKFEHSTGDSRTGQGENLWVGTSGAYGFEEMIGYWVDEKRYYRHGTFPDVSSTGKWSDVGHYTQIVWRDTTRVGCAIATGRERDWLVCRYAPQGNIVGRKAY